MIPEEECGGETETQKSQDEEGSEVFVWGNDEHGQLGIGNQNNSLRN